MDVRLKNRDGTEIPAMGALIDWNTEMEGGRDTADANGHIEITLEENADIVHQLSAYLPWQSTCLSPMAKVYQTKILSNIDLIRVPPYITDLDLTLKEIEAIEYDIQMAEGFHSLESAPLLYSNTNGYNKMDVTSCNVIDGKIKLDLDRGATKAYLYMQEKQSVIVQNLGTCSMVWPSENSLGLKKSIRLLENTVQVFVKLVNNDFRAMPNTKLSYILGEFSGTVNEIMTAQNGVVTFFLPEGFLVHLPPHTVRIDFIFGYENCTE